jgi:hypothetical protein
MNMAVIVGKQWLKSGKSYTNSGGVTVPREKSSRNWFCEENVMNDESGSTCRPSFE